MPPRPVEETQSTTSGVQWSIWRAIEDDVYSHWVFFFFLLSFGWRKIAWCLLLGTIPGRFLFSCLGLLPVLYSKTNKTPVYFLSWKTLSVVHWEALPSPTLTSLFSLATKGYLPLTLTIRVQTLSIFLPALNTRSQTPLKGHWALLDAFQQCFYPNFCILDNCREPDLMTMWNNFVSCDFPNAGIHIQRWGQEKSLAQILKEGEIKWNK